MSSAADPQRRTPAQVGISRARSCNVAGRSPRPPKGTPVAKIDSISLDRPDTLRPQIRAILRAADEGAKLHVMFPMVATLEEFRRARAIDVVALAISSEPDQRITLREAVYEATAAMATTAGVVGILSDFVA